jgi:hypothetical protein
LIFFRYINFSGDCLFQFIDGPMRYRLPAHGALLPWRIKMLPSPDAPHSPGNDELMPKKKNLSIGFCWAIGTNSLRPVPVEWVFLTSMYRPNVRRRAGTLQDFDLAVIVDMLGDLTEIAHIEPTDRDRPCFRGRRQDRRRENCELPSLIPRQLPASPMMILA